MEALRIVLYDTNPMELQRCEAICRAICAKKQEPAIFTVFSNGQTLLFEMMSPAFSSLVSILVLEPHNGGEVLAETVRRLGYDGIILYHSWATEARYFYQAFDAGAFNYASKNGPARFEAVFEGALKAARELERQCIALSCAGEYRQIDLRDIFYFETSMNHMVCVWYAGGDFLFQSSLSSLEARLADRGFIRTHRSYLVALHAVHRVSFDQVTLSDGKTIPVGRGKYAALKEALDKWSQR